MSSNPSASPQARRKDAGAALSTERPGPTASRSGRKPKEAYEAILRLPLAEFTWIYSLSAWIYPTAKELSVERLYRSRSLKNSRSGTLKNSRSGILRKIEVPTRKPTYSGDRRTVTPSVLHEDTRPTHGPTHVQNSVEGYQKTQRTIKLTGKSSHEPGSATRQRDATYAVVPQRYRDRHAPQRKLVLPPSQFPTRADLTTTPMTEVEDFYQGATVSHERGITSV